MWNGQYMYSVNRSATKLFFPLYLKKQIKSQIPKYIFIPRRTWKCNLRNYWREGGKKHSKFLRMKGGDISYIYIERNCGQQIKYIFIEPATMWFPVPS